MKIRADLMHFVKLIIIGLHARVPRDLSPILLPKLPVLELQQNLVQKIKNVLVVVPVLTNYAGLFVQQTRVVLLMNAVTKELVFVNKYVEKITNVDMTKFVME